MISITLSLIILYFIQKELKSHPDKKYLFVLIDFIAVFCLFVIMPFITNFLVNFSGVGLNYLSSLLITDVALIYSLVIPLVFFIHVLYIIFDFGRENDIKKMGGPIQDGLEAQPKKPRVLTLVAGAGLSIIMGVISFFVLFLTSLILYPPRCE